ncbi:MAG TPA: hypothetical protein VFP84_26815 [Kofleriaceae bacterium]|nr:hypothetical protein [Kofleriaceae bacterium]
MMGWQKLVSAQVLERQVQDLFEGWASRPDPSLFGLPDWLAAIRQAPIDQDLRRRTSFGYDFIPDVEFVVGTQRFVLELKHGVKYEPLALAEVLHHAAWLKRYAADDASQVVPVIVSQYSAWLRLAIDEYLRAAVRHVEVSVLAEADGKSLFAFDVPLAPWRLAKTLPDWLAALEPPADLHWHHVAENDSWFGLKQKLRTRPTVLEEPYVWLVRSGERVLAWEGWAARLGERMRDARSADGLLDANGRYFLSTPHVGEEGPTWLAGWTP